MKKLLVAMVLITLSCHSQAQGLLINETTFTPSDSPVGPAINGIISVANDDLSTLQVIYLDVSDAGPDPAPFLIDNLDQINGNLDLRGVGGNVVIEGTSSTVGALLNAGVNSNVNVHNIGWRNPSGPVGSVHSNGEFCLWNFAVESHGGTPAIVVDNAIFEASLGSFRTDCTTGDSWTIDAQNGEVELNGVTFILGEGCTNAGLDCPSCSVQARNSYYGADVNVTGEFQGHNNVHNVGWVNFGAGVTRDFPPAKMSDFKQTAPGGSKPQSLCNDFGTDAFISLGYNIDSDGSCFLDQPTDLPNTDPIVVFDGSGIPQPMAGSPVIESGPVEFINNELPCLYKDLNGLGRPQDFDLDGVFTCDRGPVEIQGGDDIGAPQSAAFYDSGRSGEGAFVEILENGLAVVSFYSFSMDGLGLSWFVGKGRVVGNSVVVDSLQRVTGGVFGNAFDPAKIVRIPVGGMSLVFPDCDATDNPGMINFTAEDDSGFENLLQEARRLTYIVDCDGSPPAANANRSGAFYNAARSGEGIFVQWLSDGRVILVFYTFDSEGNEFWAISDANDTMVVGNTVTAPMLYARRKTRFGSNFDPDEVSLSLWGTVTLEYSDKDNLEFSYMSDLDGFGVGSLDYTRLTTLLGTD